MSHPLWRWKDDDDDIYVKKPIPPCMAEDVLIYNIYAFVVEIKISCFSLYIVSSTLQKNETST